ncbi:MAG TPA: type II secretion system protein [Gemmatimonadales bacterium]|jgi:type II secretory pathway pseudopilin PulG|nr:type II secretion system protein [Gemmatimonadales bacterium]
MFSARACRNRGSALLEAIVALAIVSVAGLSMLELVSASQRERNRLDDYERLVAGADRVLTAMVLLTRQDLDRRLGTHAVAAYAVNVTRPEMTLYRIAVGDSLAPEVELLTTVVYHEGPRP